MAASASLISVSSTIGCSGSWNGCLNPRITDGSPVSSDISFNFFKYVFCASSRSRSYLSSQASVTISNPASSNPRAIETVFLTLTSPDPVPPFILMLCLILLNFICFRCINLCHISSSFPILYFSNYNASVSDFCILLAEISALWKILTHSSVIFPYLTSIISDTLRTS